jgi:hypothetical protein
MYATPHANREAMRARNRSEGDILQYMNPEVDLSPTQPYQVAYQQPPQPRPPQPQFNQYRQPFPQPHPAAQPRPQQLHPAAMPRYGGPRPMVHPGYEYMRPAMHIQRPPFQQPQAPMMQQRRPQAPAAANMNVSAIILFTFLLRTLYYYRHLFRIARRSYNRDLVATSGSTVNLLFG